MNNVIGLPATETSSGWLMFAGIFLAICLPVFGLILWFVLRPKGKKRKRKRRRHHRENPSLAEKGGLPPKRDPDQPPHGL